jgi:hypothetical protein
MPAELKVGQQVPFFVIGTDANGQRTATVGKGQTVNVQTNSTAVSITADPTPSSAPDGGPSLASGVITALFAGVAILEADLLNADGSIAASVRDSVTVDAVAPGPATDIAFQFGVPA